MTTRVKKVRKSGAKALKYDILMDPSNLLVRSTRNTSSGITRKLYPVPIQWEGKAKVSEVNRLHL